MEYSAGGEIGLELPWNCPGIALELPWNCPGTALELHCQWNTIEGAPKLLGNQLRVAKLLWDWYWKFSSVIALELLWDCTVSGTRIEGAPDLLGNGVDKRVGGGCTANDLETLLQPNNSHQRLFNTSQHQVHRGEIFQVGFRG